MLDEKDVKYGRYRVLFPVRRGFGLCMATFNSIEPLFAANSADEAHRVFEGMCKLRSAVLVSSSHVPESVLPLPQPQDLYKRETRDRLHEALNVLHERATNSSNSWEMLDLEISSAQDLLEDPSAFNPEIHNNDYAKFPMQTICSLFLSSKFMIDLHINVEKLETDVNDLASHSKAEGVLGDHHAILMTPTCPLTVKDGGITLSKLIDLLQNFQILAVCEKSRKRRNSQDIEYWTIADIAPIVLLNGSRGYAQHYLDTVDDSETKQIFSFTIPDDCNVIVMACRSN
jgi:hypothetical protein